MVTTRQRKQDRRDVAGLLLSGASLAVGIAALCLNEKGEKMNEINKEKQSPAMQQKVARQQKRDAQKMKRAYKTTASAQKMKKQNEIRRYAGDIGYDGPVILLNSEGKQTEYGLVPLESACIRKKKTTKRSPVQKLKSWVAVEINSRSGGDRQAVVCGSEKEAHDTALRMRNAHRSGSQASKDCVQGIALVDTSEPINVSRLFYDGSVRRI